MHDHMTHYQGGQKSSSNRSFGFVFAAFFLLVALFPLLHGRDMRLWALIGAGAFLLLALISPNLLAPLNRAWTFIGTLLHRITSPIVLALVYFGVIVPIGLLLRLSGKDMLRLRFDKSADSYWIRRQPPGPEPESLKQLF